MSKTCIIEAEDLELLLKEQKVPEKIYSLIESKGLGGEALTSAALITISTATISAVTKVIIAALRERKKTKLSFKGKQIAFNIEGISEEKIVEMIYELTKG